MRALPVSRVLSRTVIYLGLLLPVNSCDYGEHDGPPYALPFQSCAGWGLHRGQVAKPRVSSYLAFPSLPKPRFGRSISVALSLESPPPGVIRHPALWSSDFPHAKACDRPAASHSTRKNSIDGRACQEKIYLSFPVFQRRGKRESWMCGSGGMRKAKMPTEHRRRRAEKASPRA